MFLWERWLELLDTLRRTPLRTSLTAASVAWGVFVLVLLLGVGSGLSNGVAYQYRDDATNSLWVYRGRTSKSFAGYGVGRSIQLDLDDHDTLAESLGSDDYITSRFYPGDGRVLRYGDQAGSFDLRAVHPDHQYLEKTLITEGRFVNARDIERTRKVAVLGREAAKQLYRSANPLGTWVEIGGIPFQVVGVFADEGSVSEERQVYLPITTAQKLFNGGRSNVSQVMFTVGDASAEESELIEADTRKRLADLHDFDPNDRRAIRVRNNVVSFERIQQVLRWMEGFLWAAGLGTALAGIVGVSNIMLVSIRERTSEIGLRLALGATPKEVVWTIVAESVLLTTISGYLGLVLGVATLVAINTYVPDSDTLRNPEVHLDVAFVTTALLVLFGGIAGYLPARQAASIQPIEALREGGK